MHRSGDLVIFMQTTDIQTDYFTPAAHAQGVNLELWQFLWIFVYIQLTKERKRRKNYMVRDYSTEQRVRQI